MSPGRLTRALRSRNYRLFISGQSVSLIGTWMTRVATSWLVYRLTGSAFLLGVVGFFGQLPTLLVAPFAGVWVDRWNRHHVLVVTQILSLLQSAALAALTFSHGVTVAHVLLLQAFQGLINAFDTPARQAFVVQMVEDRADLPNAIALNSTMVTSSRVLGPSVAGMIIAVVGEGYCFAIDAVSYVAVVVSLLMMRDLRAGRVKPAVQTSVLAELAEGFRYVSRFLPVRSSLLLLSLVSLMGMPFTVLMPAVATKVLHGGPHLLGFLMAASGAGAVLGALYMASRKDVRGLDQLLPRAAGLFGVALLGFGAARVTWLALPLLALVGGGFMVQMAATNTLIQTLVTEELRGRVMAFYTMAFLGTAPLGSLLAGTVAARLGTSVTIMGGGVICACGAIIFALRLPRIREAGRAVFLERGIMVAVETDASAHSV